MSLSEEPPSYRETAVLQACVNPSLEVHYDWMSEHITNNSQFHIRDYISFLDRGEEGGRADRQGGWKEVRQTGMKEHSECYRKGTWM